MTLEDALNQLKKAQKNYLSVYYGPSITAVMEASDALDKAQCAVDAALTKAELATQ